MKNSTPKKKKVHRHQWEYSYDDCQYCGFEERWCKKDECHEMQGREPGEKWREI